MSSPEFADPAAFRRYPDAIRPRLLALRQLIFMAVEEPLRHCIVLALTYHLRKRTPRC